MKFLQNCSQAFFNVKFSLQLLTNMILNFYLSAAERKHRTEISPHMQETEIIDNQSHFKVNLGIRTIKSTWWNNFSKNGEEHCLKF